MLKFIVHKGRVFYLLYAVGGLLMTVSAGSRCVDVAVRTVQNPANLLRLSNTLIGLLGLRCHIRAVNSTAKQKLKRLYFTDSLNSLLDVTRTTLQGTPALKVSCWFPAIPEQRTNPEWTSANGLPAKRCRIYYVLLCGVSRQPVVTLCVGSNGSKLKTSSPSNPLQWLMSFSRKAQARGDVVFLLLGGQTGQTSPGSDTTDGTDERRPAGLTLGLSALSVVLLWMCLPHIAACVVICLGWKVQQHIRRVL